MSAKATAKTLRKRQNAAPIKKMQNMSAKVTVKTLKKIQKKSAKTLKKITKSATDHAMLQLALVR